ncbi:MAG: LysR family transcriptional regulator [Nannocystales bacterium]
MTRTNDLDLTLLRTFRLFARLGSVQATALELGRSQPAISARLHQLQREIGADLFVKSGRRLVLTPLGRTLDRRAGVVVDGVRALLDEVATAAERPIGVLRIGALPTLGVFVLGRLLPEFASRFPDVELELEYQPDPTSASLRSGEFDVLMGVGEPPGGEVATQIIGVARPVLVVARSGTKARRTPVRARTLQSMSWVGYGPTDDAFFSAVWSYLSEHGLASRVRPRVRHIETLKALVRHSTDATILPDYTVVEADLHARPIADLKFSMPVWVAVRSSSLGVSAIDAFLDALRQAWRRRG